MRSLLFTGFMFCAGATAFGQAIWTGPPGGGMLGVQEPWVATTGHGALGVVLDNYDRDPLGLDIDEVRTSLRVGVGHKIELFGSWYFSRAVTIPGAHPLPPPPVDIVIASGPVPTPPYRSTYWPLPYVAGRSSSVGDFIPGDMVLGLKRQLWEQQGVRPACSLSINAVLPTSHNLRNLHRGSGSGSVDVALHGAAAWYLGRWTLAGNLGYMRSGPIRVDDRIITADGISDAGLLRPDFIRMTAGARFRLHRRVSLMTEAFHLKALGGHTRTEDPAGATDVLVGMQLDLGHLTLTTGYRQHLWPPPTAMPRVTGPLAGAVDLSGVPMAQQDAYLEAIGAPTSGRRADSALIVAGAPPGVPLPPGAYRLPATYLTSTTGNGGAVLMIAWKF